MLSPPFERAPALAELAPGVTHAFSRSLHSPADHEAFAAAAGLKAMPLLRLRQVHGAGVVRADAASLAAAGSAAPAPEGDALVCDRPGVALAVAHADCVPVLLADAEAQVIAAVHAGWRGMRSRVLPAAVAAMVKLGAEPARLRAAIGPAVQGSCYEVGDEVRAEFAAAFGDVSRFFAGRKLDLVAAARSELAGAGVDGERVSVIPLCTHCRPELASYRREGQARGTNLAVIALGASLGKPAS